MSRKNLLTFIYIFPRTGTASNSNSKLHGRFSNFWPEELARIHPALVTMYGVLNNAYAGELQAVITSDDLFS